MGSIPPAKKASRLLGKNCPGDAQKSPSVRARGCRRGSRAYPRSPCSGELRRQRVPSLPRGPGVRRAQAGGARVRSPAVRGPFPPLRPSRGRAFAPTARRRRSPDVPGRPRPRPHVAPHPAFEPCPSPPHYPSLSPRPCPQRPPLAHPRAQALPQRRPRPPPRRRRRRAACTAGRFSAAAPMGVVVAARKPRTRVACWCAGSVACGAPRACSTTACRTPRATSRTRAPASRGTRVPRRAGLRWPRSPWPCPASAAMRPCARATGSRRDVAAPAAGVATRRRRGEEGLVGPVAAPRTPN